MATYRFVDGDVFEVIENGALSNRTKPLRDQIAALERCARRPVHTNHPLRHYDRTCPACKEGK